MSRTKAVPGEGAADARVLFIGEAPGHEEDLSGRPFVGRAGRILDAALIAARLPRPAVFITNVVKCRPPGNRRPKSDEVQACRAYLLTQIAAVDPRVIVTLGATALRGLMGPGHELGPARHERLKFRTDPEIATYQPAGNLNNRKLETLFRGDLRKVARIVRKDRRRPTGGKPSPGRSATR